MPKKILVADDSVVIQKSIGITFAQEDFQVSFVGNGEEAFQRAKDLRPDLILADTSMPKLAGADLCKKFRSEAEFRRTPIILLASTQETYTAGQLKACGANDFIQKPFESATLIEKVKAQISGGEPAAAPQPSPMELSIDNAFGSPGSVSAEEETAITNTPPRGPEPIVLEQSEEFSVDFTAAAYDNPIPTPSPDTIASLDVLSIEDSEEHAPQNFVPYEEEKTKAEPSDPKLRQQAAPARPAPTPTPASASLELSEDQIEKIVSKVFQNVIERIAWEVVPEMAERLIKEELKKITDDPK